MRKKSWGRLGVAVGVVALLAGGLVGVPAHAEQLRPPLYESTDGNGNAYETGSEVDMGDGLGTFATAAVPWYADYFNRSGCEVAAKNAVATIPEFFWQGGPAEFVFDDARTKAQPNFPDQCITVWQKVSTAQPAPPTYTCEEVSGIKPVRISR